MRTQLGWHTDGSLARPWAENPSYTTPDPQERWRNKCVLLGAADSWWFVTHKQKMNCFKTFYYGAYLKHFIMGNSLVVQWFGLWASTAGGKGLIPGWGTQIPQAARCGQFFFFYYGKVQTYTERVNCLVYPYLVSAVINTWPILFLSVLLLIEKSKC